MRPGVGSYDEGVRRLRSDGWFDNLLGLPSTSQLLGICLGVQLLGTTSEEGRELGLDRVPAHSQRFSTEQLQVPHMGWIRIFPPQPDPLFDPALPELRYYFTHSYRAVCDDDTVSIGTTYYSVEFTPAFRRANTRGVQFHPEKSYRFGMPLAYGDGVRNLEDAKRLFSLGIEKLVLRSAAMTDLPVVTEIADYAGASSVTVSADVKKPRIGRHRLFGPGASANVDSDWTGFIRKVINAGAGEIVLNSVDRDGNMSGLDKSLITAAAQVTTVPLVAVGGVASLDHIRAGVDAGSDAVGAISIFVFYGPRRAVLITYPSYEELTTLLGAE